MSEHPDEHVQQHPDQHVQQHGQSAPAHGSFGTQLPPETTAQMWSRGGGRRRRGGRSAERAMVPEATFSTYYGRPIVKPARWEARDIAGYFFAGGLAAGSSVLAAGADISGRPALRRTARLGAAVALVYSTYALVHDLGRPDRFYNMLRVIKPTSPMSMGSWFLATYAPFASAAAASEITGLLPLVGRLSGFGAAITAPSVASYTAVLASNTATPTWHEAWRELPFVFVSSAAAAGAGLGLIGAPVAQNAPARRLAQLSWAVELAATERMERRMGLLAEPMHAGRAGRLLDAAKFLTAGGALTATALGHRSRLAAAASGVALLAGSACTRFGIFYAGVASAEDPKYVVVPQRERLRAGDSAAAEAKKRPGWGRVKSLRWLSRNRPGQ